MGQLTGDALEKIAKLIPMLASDKPGDVTAAAGALARVLKAAGCDFHDLAKLIREGGGVRTILHGGGKYRTPGGPTMHAEEFRTPGGRGFYRYAAGEAMDGVWADFSKSMDDLLNSLGREAADELRRRTYGKREPKADRAERASRTQAEYRAKKAAQAPKRVPGEVPAHELEATIGEIEKRLGGSFTDLIPEHQAMLERMLDKCRNRTTVRLTPAQERWLRALAGEHGVTVLWPPFNSEAA